MPIRQHTNIFGTTLPLYGVCVGIGLLSIGIWMLLNFKWHRMDGNRQNEILFGFPFMVLFGTLTAFLLDALFTGDWKTWGHATERRFGFTFTGWLAGVIVFIWCFGNKTSFGRIFLFNMFLPVFALAQAFGRIGCFLGGCCYGCPCGWGMSYPPGSMPYEHMGNVPLFPVQLVESGFLFALFAGCVFTPFSRRGGVYLIGVGAIRFVLEFFRADVRGSFLWQDAVSPQQIMSLLFFLIGLFFLAHERIDSRKVMPENG